MTALTCPFTRVLTCAFTRVLFFDFQLSTIN